MTDAVGTLQSRGVGLAIIDGEKYQVPEYVVPFLSRRSDGDKVDYRFEETKDGRRLTKIAKHIDLSGKKAPEPKPQPKPEAAMVKVIKYNEVAIQFELITDDPGKGGKRLANITPDQHSRLVERDVKPGDEIALLFDDKGFAWIPEQEFKKASDIHLQNNLDQMRKESPVGGVTKSETPKETPPCADVNPPATPATGPSSGGSLPTTDCKDPVVRVWSEVPRISIGITVNLENYENLKLEIEGAESDSDQLIARLNEVLDKFGNNHAPTKDMIGAYRRRVLP